MNFFELIGSIKCFELFYISIKINVFYITNVSR